MNPLKLVLRSLRFYWRTGLGVLAGCAVSSAVLVGALFVGDSVRESLVGIALTRLGGVDVALQTGNRYFRDDLPARMGLETGAAILAVKGMAVGDDPGGGAKQVNRVEVLGVDAAFFKLADSTPDVDLSAGKVAISEKLASALAVKAGDDLSLRMFKPGIMARDAPLASRDERDTQRSLLTVSAVLGEKALGRFSLRADQSSPYNAFVDRAWLQEALELERRANVLIAGEASAEDAQAALLKTWKIEDLDLKVRSLDSRKIAQLESPRIYLDPAVSLKALELKPGAVGALSYLVDSLASRSGKSTPYSFLTALSSSTDRNLGPVPPDMKDDEIIVNRWVADHLEVGVGDEVVVGYRELTPKNEFVDRSRTFRVRAVVEMAALTGEKELVPEFPGLTDVDSCRDWNVKFEMDEEKLNDKANEEYWETYRQTPKAFVTLNVGRDMWANRFGDLMAVRYPAAAGGAAAVAGSLRSSLDPERAGLSVQPVRVQALKAARESMDLGQLFLGMSIFLIAASLVLTAMLFVFSVEHRAREMGVLLGVGFTTGRVRSLFLVEGAAIAALGSLAGIPFGWAFAKFLIWGLVGAWSGAVADASIEFHAAPASAAIGAGAAAVMSLAAVALAMWRQARRPVRELVSEDFSLSQERRAAVVSSGWLRKGIFALATAGAVAIAVGTVASGARNPAPSFFAAGALMLIGGIALIRIILARLSTSAPGKITVAQLGIRNAARRPGRGMATAGMLACGCFVVLSVSAMKEDLTLQAGERGSGTGGFEFYGESSVAVDEDLNTARGRERYRLDEEQMKGVSIHPIKVHEGDDASCLNMNLSLRLPLLGVDPATFGDLGAFEEPETAKGFWGLLERDLPDGVVPAIIGDSATAMWKLKLPVGPEDGALLDYLDERGEDFKVKLVGQIPRRLSVFQGRLLVSNRHFTRLYPSEGGYRMFVVDAPEGEMSRVRDYLTRRLDRVGLDLVPSVDRLREFYVVESAYLTMFLVLGGMGLLLGTAGMAVLVLRNVMERRSELALLRAVGYSPTQAGEVVMSEHFLLLAAGLLTGTVASILAVGPAAARPEIDVPVLLLVGFLVGTAVLSLLWIWTAARMALRAPLVPALRNE